MLHLLFVRGLTGEDGRFHIGDPLHTEGCAVVLVEHQAVEARLGVHLLVQVAIIEFSPDRRVVQPVTNIQGGVARPHEVRLLVLPGLLCEVSDKHGLFLLAGRLLNPDQHRARFQVYALSVPSPSPVTAASLS
jgi:hypothetical protein